MLPSWTKGCRPDGWGRRRSGYSGTTGKWWGGVDKVDPLPPVGLEEVQVVRRHQEEGLAGTSVVVTEPGEDPVTDLRRTVDRVGGPKVDPARLAAKIRASVAGPMGGFLVCAPRARSAGWVAGPTWWWRLESAHDVVHVPNDGQADRYQ